MFSVVKHVILAFTLLSGTVLTRHSVAKRITCSTVTNCNVNCTKENCKEATIDGSNATTLTVNCGDENTCQRTHILCPYTQNSSCIIACTHQNSCDKLSIKITSPKTELFDLTCSSTNRTACNGLQFSANTNSVGTVINTANIHSTSSGKHNAIQQSNFNFNSADIGNLNVSIWSLLHESAEKTLKIMNITAVKSTKMITLACNGHEACYGVSLQKIELKTSNAQVDITCDEYSCTTMNFEISGQKKSPSATISIFCADHGCTNNTYSFDYINTVTINCSADMSCWNNFTSIRNVNSMGMYCSDKQSCKGIVDISANAFNLYCTGEESCRYTKISYGHLYNLAMLCSSEKSCYNMSFGLIGGAGIGNMQIACTGQLSCAHSSMFFQTMYANMKQSGIINCQASANACSNASFRIANSYTHEGAVNVLCNSTDCEGSHWAFGALDKVHFDCFGELACSTIAIEAAELLFLNLTCRYGVKNGMEACRNMDIYCPFSSTDMCHINCTDSTGDSCDAMNIYVPSNYVYGFLNRDYYQCSSTNIFCEPYDTDPSKHSVSFIDSANASSPLCECDSYDSNSCCPWLAENVKPIICHLPQDCSVQCVNGTQCTDIYVDGSKSQILEVNCSNDHSCRDSILLCPMSTHGECNIFCNGKQSCKNLQINTADVQSVVNLHCFGNNSCYNLTMYASNANEITIKTSYLNQYSYGVHVFAENAHNLQIFCNLCDQWRIFASAVESVKLTCNETLSCQNFDVDVANAKTVNLIADGNYSWYYGSLQAFSVSALTISCASMSTNQSACFKGNYYIPEMAVNVYCYGFGCYDLGKFYVLDEIQQDKFIINGCKKCDLWSECVSSFEIYCDYSSQNNEYQHSVLLNPNDVDRHYCNDDYCGCDYLVSDLQKEWRESSSTYCPYHESNTNKMLFYIIGASAAGLICIVVSVVLCKCFSSNETNDSPINENHTSRILGDEHGSY